MRRPLYRYRLDADGQSGKTSPVTAVLAIVGCGARLEIALGGEFAPAPGVVVLSGPTPRSELVVAAIDLLLRSAGLDPSELTKVLATRGPGSFTGIRVALATAQGLARALGCPACGLPSLAVLAARSPGGRRVAVQGARRGFVYRQTFEERQGQLEAVDEPRLEEVAALAQLPDPVVAAEGLQLPEGVRRALPVRSAVEALLELGRDEEGDVESLTPIYLEPPQAQPPRRRAG